MASTVRLRSLIQALLALVWMPSLLRGQEVLQAPQVPPPGSVTELFRPTVVRASGSPLPPPPTPSPLELPPPAPSKPAEAAPPLPTETGKFAGMKPGDRERRKLKNTSTGEWGFVSSEFVWRAPEPGYDAPFERGEWSTEDLVAIPVTGPLYFFSEVIMGGEYAADQTMTMIGRTGFLWKLSLDEKNAIEVRGGPSVRYQDAAYTDRTREQAEVLWAVKAKAPLLGPIGMEYSGEAQPSVTPEAGSQVRSDLFLFLPVSGGKLKVGARHSWEEGQREVRSTSTIMQWYLGLEIGR